MRRPFPFWRGARGFALRAPQWSKRVSQPEEYASIYFVMGLLLVGLLLGACSSPFGGNGSATPTPATQALSKIGWCSKPVLVFRDEGAVTPTASATPTSATGTVTPTAGPGTPSTLKDWPAVKAALGFTVYLPTALPSGSCLLSAQATIHDPTYGGSFVIGYLLPDHTSLSISEAPLTTQKVSFECNPTSNTVPTSGQTGTPTPTAPATKATIQLCSGARETTNIVLAGPGSVAALEQIFNHLQANVNWIPAASKGA